MDIEPQAPRGPSLSFLVIMVLIGLAVVAVAGYGLWIFCAILKSGI